MGRNFRSVGRFPERSTRWFHLACGFDDGRHFTLVEDLLPNASVRNAAINFGFVDCMPTGAIDDGILSRPDEPIEGGCVGGRGA